MTPKQFLKKYVSKENREEAENVLHEIIMDAEGRGFDEAITESKRCLRGIVNEMTEWGT